jgi:hypothetical protein
MHGRTYYLRELRYGFAEDFLYLRVDLFPEAFESLDDSELRISVRAAEEVSIVARLAHGRLAEFAVERELSCLLNPREAAEAAFDRILEVAVRREALNRKGCASLSLGVALWHGGLPVDVLPAQGHLEARLGEEHFAWGIETQT